MGAGMLRVLFQYEFEVPLRPFVVAGSAKCKADIESGGKVIRVLAEDGAEGANGGDVVAALAVEESQAKLAVEML